MEINEMNYELYALDYAAGVLTGEALVEMEAFLALNPEIAAELFVIAGTKIPADETYYTDKEGLKRKGRAVAILPWAFAVSSAACLVLALGLIWMIGQQQRYGELAHTNGSSIHLRDLNGQFNGSTLIGDEIAQQTDPALAVVPQKSIDPSEATANVSVHTHDALVDDRMLVGSEHGPAHKTDDIVVQMDAGSMETISLDSDMSYVIPVTIEMHALSTDGNDKVRSELDAIREQSEAKMARRQLIKDGALSMLQERLLPSGVVNLIDN